MTRPFDWTPLAAGDPIPGDPELVERAGRDYQKIAKAIETAASRLRTIASDVSMQSDAVAQIRERADGLAQQVGRAQERYEAIGFALVGYARVLTDAQATSLRALRMAQDANANLVLARYGVNDASFRAKFLDPGSAADLATAQRREANATADLASAQAILDQAVQYRDDAAEAARRVIDAAKSHDGLNDSRWDNIKAATIGALESVSKVVDMIAIGAGLLALVFAFVPVLGEFFAAVALIASVAALALKLSLKAFGEGSWLDIGVAALAVASFGVGKVAIGSGEFAATGARAYARLGAGPLAAEARQARAAAGLPAFSNASDALGSVVGAGNYMSRTAARSAVALSEQSGPLSSLGRAYGVVRSIPDTVLADVTDIRAFDIHQAAAEVRNNHQLLTFLGERGAGADSLALKNMHPELRELPQVSHKIWARRAATGGFVGTWLTGNGVLGHDTWHFFRGESGPAELLHLAE